MSTDLSPPSTPEEALRDLIEGARRAVVRRTNPPDERPSDPRLVRYWERRARRDVAIESRKLQRKIARRAAAEVRA